MKKLTSRKQQPHRKAANGSRTYLKSMPAALPWQPDLNGYAELKALTFTSPEEMDTAIDLLWSDPLRNLPHELAGGDTIIVPGEAVGYFEAAHLTFSQDDVLSASDLPADELNELRREQGPY
jgi:hypothetical protein